MSQYATLEELLDYRDAQEFVPQDDEMMDRVLVATSAAIDEWCGRSFYPPGDPPDPASPRKFNAGQFSVLIDDCVSVTETSAGVGFNLEPFNADVRDEPFTTLTITGTGQFPSVVDVTGVWGWPVTPPQIKEACLIKAARLAKRPESPLGVLGTDDWGPIRLSSREDSDVIALLAPLRRSDRTLGIA